LVTVNLISITRVAFDPLYMKDDYRALAEHLSRVRGDAIVFVIGPTSVLEYYGAQHLRERRDAGEPAFSESIEIVPINSPYWVVLDRVRKWDWDPNARLQHLMVPKGMLPQISFSNVELYFIRPQGTGPD
jgi:hypothetical protein